MMARDVWKALLTLSLLLLGAATAPNAQSVASPSLGLIADNSRVQMKPRVAPSSAHATMRVLFIGSSATRSNDLPQLVEKIAASKADGALIASTLIALPGAILRSHIVEYTLASALDRPWDYVVLEEDYYLRQTPDRTPPTTATASTKPTVGAPEAYHDAVRELSAKIRLTVEHRSCGRDGSSKSIRSFSHHSIAP